MGKSEPAARISLNGRGRSGNRRGCKVVGRFAAIISENAVFCEASRVGEMQAILCSSEGCSLHGQKKRRKRTIEGKIEIGELVFDWHLLSEPLWSSEHGFKGLCLAVQAEGEAGRGLILQYPYPTNKLGSPLPLPQRPTFTAKSVEEGVRAAMKEGWEPLARGKALVFHVS